MNKETGGPAFPSESADGFIHTGMTLRDYFAAKAMAADIATSYHSVNDIAELAYKMADAMLEARGKE